MGYGIRWVLALLLLVLQVAPAWAQDVQGGERPVSLSGTVVSGGQPVELASVYLSPGNVGATTDAKGSFRLGGVPAGRYTLIVSCVGYERRQQTLELAGDQTLAVSLVQKTNALNEVVITGATKATLLRENPLALVAIGPKAIERSAENNIVDVLAHNTPGLAVLKTGPNISKPYIRGLGYNRVLTLYDGIRQEGQQWGDEHGIEVDAYGIQRAEVIKGPASLMYGSDAVAGVVSLFPYIPTRQDGKLHVKYTTEYQSNNGLIGNGLRLGYSGAHWLWAVRGSYRRAHNYQNAADGYVYNTGFAETNASGLVGYQTEKGYLHLNATLYHNLQGIPDGSRDSVSRAFTVQTQEGQADDVRTRRPATRRELEGYALSPLHQRIRHYRVYAHANRRVGQGEVDLLLAAQQNLREEYNHPTAPAQAGLSVRLNTLNYGLRYNAPAWGGLETAVGLNGMAQANRSLDATDFPIPDFDLVDGGVYAHAKYRRDRWTLSGGARYDLRRIAWHNLFVATDPATGFGRRAGADAPGAAHPYTSFAETFGGASASAGATYQAGPHLSIKANVARGYRSPGITELSSNGLDPGAHIIYLGDKTMRPEFSFQQDMGVAAVYDDFSAGVSVFNNMIQDYIYIAQVVDAAGKPLTDAQGNRTFGYRQSAAHLYGVETDAQWHPAATPGLEAWASAALLYGNNTGAEYRGQGRDGRYLPFIQPARGQAGASYKIGLPSARLPYLQPRAEVEAAAPQDRYLALYATESRTPAYALLHLGLATELNLGTGNTLMLQAQVNNVLDRVYQSNLSRLKYFEYYAQGPAARSGIYAMGRNVCVKAVLSF